MRFDKELASVYDKDPKIMRFYAARMIVELSLGIRLSKDAQRQLFNCCDVKIFGGQ